MRHAAVMSCLGAALLGSGAVAQDLAVQYRNSADFGSSATDQFGATFTVVGVSGITYIGGDTYWAVMDNSNKLVKLVIRLNDSGAITSATIAGGLSLAASHDHEDLAWTGPVRNSVVVCEEDTPAVREYSLADGSAMRVIPTPAIFANRRANFGFEGLTLDASGSMLWVANEEALSVDGGVSTPSAGTRVRLQAIGLSGGDVTPLVQHGYLTEPMHAGAIQGGRSGLSAMVTLPSGRVLTLERSLANNFLRFFESRLYEITTEGATDTSALASLTQEHVSVTKRLLYRGGLTNVEGLCVGPRIGGGYALLGVVDDGDPISVNRVVSFVVTGPVDPVCPADFNGDGFLDFFDYDDFVGCYEGGACPPGGRTADFNGDAFVDFFDYDDFVHSYEQGC